MYRPLRKQARLIDEFRGLEVREATVKLAFWHFGDRLQEGKRDLSADD